MQRRGYRWWVDRLRRTFSLFDLARIDHFRGFVSYWSVPARAKHALSGSWKRGPGRAVFDAAARGLERELPLIAEDLGVVTPAVERLRDGLGCPGMVVLQFGFDPGDMGSVHNPWNHVEQRVVYTGTHDHDTVRGWYESICAGAARAGRPLDRRGRRARGRAVVVADPARVRLARAAWRWCRRRTCSGSAARRA